MKLDEMIGTIINGDCLNVMKEIPDNSIDLVVTSPPYNKGYYDKHTPSVSDNWRRRNIKYDTYVDNVEPELYAQNQKKIISELVRIIKPLGSIFYNHKMVIADHRVIYPQYVFDFNVRQIITWDRDCTPQIAPIRFFPTSEYIFWITKTNCQPKYYRRGKQDKEVWRIRPSQYDEHPASFSIEIPNQCILSTTDENDIVFDCYMGSGTTAVSAEKLNRRWLGIEISEKYCEIARARIKKEQDQMKLF